VSHCAATSGKYRDIAIESPARSRVDFARCYTLLVVTAAPLQTHVAQQRHIQVPAAGESHVRESARTKAAFTVSFAFNA
jgi:hypothetical protein